MHAWAEEACWHGRPKTAHRLKKTLVMNTRHRRGKSSEQRRCTFDKRPNVNICHTNTKTQSSTQRDNKPKQKYSQDTTAEKENRLWVCFMNTDYSYNRLNVYLEINPQITGWLMHRLQTNKNVTHADNKQKCFRQSLLTGTERSCCQRRKWETYRHRRQRRSLQCMKHRHRGSVHMGQHVLKNNAHWFTQHVLHEWHTPAQLRKKQEVLALAISNISKTEKTVRWAHSHVYTDIINYTDELLKRYKCDEFSI